ncbi:alpha/beta hydrolase family protein [Flavobacterium limi]|uniref:alpha/beta hydrolase family protein n=1 Tax=Flavobacterium limi TaxID=2045105 RepID=UPI0013D04388|nr:prolyl oligopeptidase family serine peptidase [Flavobacterium limi]
MLLNIIKKHRRTIQFRRMQCPFFLFILPLVACPLWGQAVQKKILTPEEYHKWGETVLQKISPDEKWASYKIEYEKGADTLFVRNIFKKTSFAFPHGENGRFMQDIFVCMINKELHILDLKRLEEKIIKEVKSYSFSDKESQLIYQIDTASQNSFLEIFSLKTGRIKKIPDVSDYLLSPTQQKLWFTASRTDGYSTAVISLKNPALINWIQKKSPEKFTSPVWQKHGQAVAFIKEYSDPGRNILYFYNIKNNKIYELGPKTDSLFFKNWSVTVSRQLKIMISDDLQSIFFAVKKNTAGVIEQKKIKAEVWSTNDKWIYPYEKSQQVFQGTSKSAVWNPVSGKTNVITSDELPAIMMDGAMKYSYLSNRKAYEPQFEYEGPRDFYTLNLKTFEKKIFLKKHAWDSEALNPSPAGKYFAYFKDDNWWLYSPSSDTHTNITSGLGVKFKGKKQELVPESVYGNPGWTNGDKEIILYDQYDIWIINPDGKKAKRLTKGREKKIIYRIINPDSRHQKVIYNGPLLETIDLTKTLFLLAKGHDGKTGCFLWKKNVGENQLYFTDRSTDQFQFTENKKSIIFREQNFDQSPRLLSIDVSSSAQTVFFKSNPQQEKYFWGRSELLEFQNSKGDTLKGVLLYPANYDPEKKYPMIVNIYQEKAYELHIYENPTFYNAAGFNATLMTLNGYFVLLPDIISKDHNAGISALDCVTAAVAKVISKNLILPEKVGLIGHSYGGYESAFIVTQTALFAASVASGAPIDLVSRYYSVGREGKPEMWRFEKEQTNMGGSPSDYPDRYDANSPIRHVSKIKKPVLIWSGKNDKQVDHRQSLEFYLALRRLKKRSNMILYPDEGHLLLNPENQKDITVRTMEWFNYYLKDDHSPSWITESTN